MTKEQILESFAHEVIHTWKGDWLYIDMFKQVWILRKGHYPEVPILMELMFR